LAKQLQIHGGTPLVGELQVSGAKNAALPIMAADPLTDQPCRLENMPRLAAVDDAIALLGTEELGAQDRQIVARARRLQRFLTQPFSVTEACTGMQGKSVTLSDTIAGCRAILDGEADDWAESSLYMIGTLGEARQKEAAAAKAEHPS